MRGWVSTSNSVSITTLPAPRPPTPASVSPVPPAGASHTMGGAAGAGGAARIGGGWRGERTKPGPPTLRRCSTKVSPAAGPYTGCRPPVCKFCHHRAPPGSGMEAAAGGEGWCRRVESGGRQGGSSVERRRRRCWCTRTHRGLRRGLQSPGLQLPCRWRGAGRADGARAGQGPRPCRSWPPRAWLADAPRPGSAQSCA